MSQIVLFWSQVSKEGSSAVKNPPANAGNSSWIPGLGRPPGVGNGNPLQYYCLGNPMNRGAWWVSPLGCKSDMTLQLNNKQQSTEQVTVSGRTTWG